MDPMKSKRNEHLFFLIALLVCACSKELVSTEPLKGTWKVYDQNAYFCGKEVSKGIDYFEAEDVQMTFSEGRVSFLEDGEAFSYPCTSSGKTINMQAIFFTISMRIRERSEKEMVLDISVPGLDAYEGARCVDEFMGFEIYGDDGILGDCWYYGKQGPVFCQTIGSTQSEGWMDTARVYLRKIK